MNATANPAIGRRPGTRRHAIGRLTLAAGAGAAVSSSFVQLHSKLDLVDTAKKKEPCLSYAFKVITLLVSECTR